LRTRRVLIGLSLATVTLVMVASGVYAQESAPRTPRTPQAQTPDPPSDADPRRERVDALRQELQEIYEQLFELEVRYQAASDDGAALDSLAVEREQLHERVEDLRNRIAVEKELRGREVILVPERPGETDVYGLFEQLSKLEDGVAPEEIGSVLTIIGQQLKDLDVDVSEDRVRIETGTGSRFSFTVPEELRADLNQGMQEIGRELHRAFADSAGGARNWAQIIEQLPERMAQGWPDRRSGRRKVIAESVFSMGTDFEVAEDEIVQGDILLVGADAYVSGEVQGNVYVLAGDVLVEERGLVAKDAVSLGGEVLVDDQAEVLGRRISLGDASYFAVGAHGGGVAWAFYAGRIVILFSLLLLIYALFSDRMALMVEHSGSQPGRSVLAGAVWFTCVFGLFAVASVGLIVSVIGIPVVLVLALSMGMVSMMAYLTGCELVGRRLVTMFRPDAPEMAPWQGALIGVILLELPAIAVLVLGSLGIDGTMTRPLTGLEFILGFLALSLGFGAVVHTRLGRRPRQPEAAEPGGDVASAGV
jgi:hypothetical protein